jgi:hypothetical protein
LQIFHQFPQKIDISASNVTAILLLQKIRQNKTVMKMGFFAILKLLYLYRLSLAVKHVSLKQFLKTVKKTV